MASLEHKRMEIQRTLDKGKPAKERNVMGQFATPYQLAADIMKYIRTWLNTSTISMLEPAIGTGVFYSAFTQYFDIHSKAVGYEIDPYYAQPAAELWKGTGLEIRQADFLQAKPTDEKFQLIVSNPPYSRHHHIPTDTKQRLQAEAYAYTGIRFSGLVGLYGYFMVLSARWLQKGGLSCWLVPAEFMGVNFGKAIKESLTRRVELLAVHRFAPDDLQFADALVTSSVVIFRNAAPANNNVRFSSGGSVSSPKTINMVGRDTLAPHSKWSSFFDTGELAHNKQTVLGDFFTVKRGIATGNNHFFIVSPNVIEEYNIPHIFLTPHTACSAQFAQ